MQIGDKLSLSIACHEENRGRSKVFVKEYAEGTVIYIHPQNRYVVFDFGWFRESIRPEEIPGRMERKAQ